jgi:diaminohydroxyphosphoribosylaminopyrimidine deaminase/5-amino-6-(5-phosphoribosylamino)uracil reductase
MRGADIFSDSNNIVALTSDQQGMALALEWAAKGLFITTPNPRVGCVIAKDGMVIGAGHTQIPGQAHAEIAALADAAARGADVRGATLYVTLEPCSHHGRTPPCADALIRAGISRVVSAIVDPNPLVAGQGHARLRAAGIELTTNVMAHEARDINLGFFKRMESGTPWVRMKVAASLDGKTALHNGNSQWITSGAARDDGHHWRARACAILTGIGTVKSDDPQLTVRAIDTPRQPRRIIVDSRLEIDPRARMLQGDSCWIIAAQPDAAKAATLQAMGHHIIYLPNADGKVDLPALMRELGKRAINELHIEAGTKLNGSLLRAGCVDELLVYFAPVVLGDAQGMFDLPALSSLDAKQSWRFHEVKQIGADLRILARLN